MASSSKGRKCADSCLDYLLVEVVRHYCVDNESSKNSATLESIGVRVGKQLVERYTRDRDLPRLLDTLEVIKFLCKEFWTTVFRKQVDNLKTNHRGVYVLQDHNFSWLQHVCIDATAPGKPSEKTRIPQEYVQIPCGMIKGALQHLGVACAVQAEITHLPSCSFTIRISG